MVPPPAGLATAARTAHSWSAAGSRASRQASVTRSARADASRSSVSGSNTWNRVGDVQPFEAYKSAGVGVRVEVPILGNVGFDWAYGFDRLVPGWKGHFLFGAMFF